MSRHRRAAGLGADAVAHDRRGYDSAMLTVDALTGVQRALEAGDCERALAGLTDAARFEGLMTANYFGRGGRPPAHVGQLAQRGSDLRLALFKTCVLRQPQPRRWKPLKLPPAR